MRRGEWNDHHVRGTMVVFCTLNIKYVTTVSIDDSKLNASRVFRFSSTVQSGPGDRLGHESVGGDRRPAGQE